MISKIVHRRDIVLVVVFSLLSVGLYYLPTGFESRVAKAAERVKAEVTAVDNAEVFQYGMVKTGDQHVSLRLLEGRFAGREVEGNNPLLGMMDRDKLFAPGDRALVVLSLDPTGEIRFVNPMAHYRLDLELLLLLLFAAALVLFGGWTGLKALLSFVLSALMLWKVFVPGLLKGYSPIWLAVAVVAVLTAVIIFLVAGPTRKGLAAFCGAMLGVLTSCLMATGFTGAFHLHGAVLPFAETLLYSGFGHLNLTQIYIAAVFVAASGAVMDLAMDVAASMAEVAQKRLDISALDLVRSGLSVGRTVVGTMTTTLLFAYSGGYVTLLMAFMAQGIPLSNMFNLVYVAAEILKTLVGSFGLVLVAPFTALVGGFILTHRRTAVALSQKPAAQR